MFSFKYRPSRLNEYENVPDGPFYFQPWIWSGSSESRIILPPNKGYKKVIVSEYYDMMKRWNLYRLHYVGKKILLIECKKEC
jgi:hypothetical protein